MCVRNIKFKHNLITSFTFSYTVSPKRKQLIWRRNKVQELLIKGLNQRQIANSLKVSDYTVSMDISQLRKEARVNIETHLQDRLPIEYQQCMAGINQVLKMSWEIAGGFDMNDNYDISSKTATLEDSKTRLQALALVNDCYKYKMDLVTNGVVITDAIKFVQQKKEELSKINNNSDTDTVVPKPGTNENKNTANKVF